MTKNTEVQTSFEEHPDHGQMMRAALAVEQIELLTQSILRSQELISTWVETGRRNGATWQQIGDALNVSRSAAQKYYGDLI